MKDITNILAAYEKYILAGIEFQKLCGKDDFKNYAYTLQDYGNKKPVSKLFLAAINTPKLFRKETENFIKEVIKASGLEQIDPELRERFKKFIYSWKRLLIEINKIPEDSREELVKNLKNVAKPDFALAEENNLKEWVYKNNDSEIVYIWDMYIDPADKGTWCSAEEYNGEYDGSVFKTKEAAYNEGKIHLYELEDEGQLRGDPEDYDIDVIEIPKNKVSEYTLEFSGL